MKKCKGCGIELQNSNNKIPGYTVNLEQDYCQRCFRLTHYGDVEKLAEENIDNNEITSIYSEYSDKLFVLIVDSFDALILDKDDLLNYFHNNKLLLIINKIDLLPRNVNDDKLEDLFINVLNKCYNSNIVNCLLTYKNDPSFNELFFNTLNNIKCKECVFVGRVNAGKTTIINKLINSNDLTVSTYPGTTVKENIINYNDFTFVDTPGLIDERSFINKLDKKLLKYLVPNKCVKPQIYQLYEPQSYFVEGLIRIDISPKKDSSISFYIKNELNVHRTKQSNGDNYIDKHGKEYKLNLLDFTENAYKGIDDKSFYIKGLGYIRIKGLSDVKIFVDKDIEIYECEVKL